MNKFGVCNYDFNVYESKVKNLQRFKTYKEAFEYYFKEVRKGEGYPYAWDSTLWIVWIEGDRIIQFEQLKENVRCRLVDL